MTKINDMPKNDYLFQKGKKNIMFGIRGDKHPSWKGDKAGYSAIHKWVNNNKSKPKYCEYPNCKQKPANLSNISGKYKRNINDFEWLCVKHHRLFDGTGWTEEDLIYLKENYKLLKDNKLMEKILKSRNAILKMRIKLGLKKYEH